MATDPELGCQSTWTPSENNDRKYCPEEWDGFVCWSPTEEGQHAFEICSDPSGSAVLLQRDCQYGGHWANSTAAAECSSGISKLGQNFTYIYEYEYTDANEFFDRYEKMQTAGRALDWISIALTILALVVWTVMWVKRSHLSPYRYAVFVTIFVSLLLENVPQMVVDITVLNQQHSYTKALCIFNKVYGSAFDLLVTSTLFVYLVFCVVAALRRTVSCAQILLGIFSAVVFSLVFSLAYVISQAVDPEEFCYQDRGNYFYHYILTVPNFVALSLVLILDVVILVFSFFMKNDRYKQSREYRLIRYSSVTVLLVTLYHSADQILLLYYFTRAGNWGYEEDSYMDFLTAHRVLVGCSGLVFSLLLCFLDLEVLSMYPCGCIEMDDGFESTLEFLPLAKPEMAAPEESAEKSHVSTFEMNLGPQGKAQYGTIPENR